jgi:hypothetical protein
MPKENNAKEQNGNRETKHPMIGELGLTRFVVCKEQKRKHKERKRST